MYTMELFNTCRIVQPDICLYQEQRRCSRRDYGASASTICSTTLRVMDSDTKNVHLGQQLRALKSLSMRLGGCAISAAVTVSGDKSSSSGVCQVTSEVSDIESRDVSPNLYYGQPTDRSELKFLRESEVRSKLMEKLSEANRYGRHICRQLAEKEEALVKCKSELSIMETELQALVALSQEIGNEGVKPGTRKINGKYIQSHLALKLEELHQHLLLQLNDIDIVCYKDVPLVWYGMAEDVQVMGSFDGWSRGVQMSPESTGVFTKFSAMLKLRPGRYEIKFLVDGEWQISPHWPTVGEGPTVNNVVVIE